MVTAKAHAMPARRAVGTPMGCSGYRRAVRVAHLWRYPVKSMQGEQCQELVLAAGGALGDRAYGVLDEDAGVVLTAKRVPVLLAPSAWWHEGGVLVRAPGQPEMRPGPE